MSYYEEERETACSSCGKPNHIMIAYAGDSRANERESARCFNCGEAVDAEKCFAIFAAETPEGAKMQLRKAQNRA